MIRLSESKGITSYMTISDVAKDVMRDHHITYESIIYKFIDDIAPKCRGLFTDIDDLRDYIDNMYNKYYKNYAEKESAKLDECSTDDIDESLGLMELVDDDDDEVYNDGWGHTKKIPKSGYSKIVTLKSTGRSFRYNFSTREVEYIDDQKIVIDSIGLSPAEWLDNPEYWAMYYDDQLDDELSYYDYTDDEVGDLDD